MSKRTATINPAYGNYEAYTYSQNEAYINDIYMAIFDAQGPAKTALQKELGRMIEAREAYERKIGWRG